MNLCRVSLSIYSFGYAAGFLHDDRPEAAPPAVTIGNVAEIARQHGLGGIEFPVDRYFKIHELDRAEAFIGGLLRNGMNVAVDLENFDPPYIRAVLPILSRHRLRFARIKMSGFYGGNRYLEPRFAEQVADFVRALRSLLPELRRAGIKLLIENHQDLGAEDLIRIIGATSSDCIGINWDIGNSLAVLDTPETFLRKAGGFVGNVHLKDYRLYRCEKGFYLSRCALGEGVVEFASILDGLKARQGQVPMAIELGAQIARRADVFEPAYLEAYGPQAGLEMGEFFAFLDVRLHDGEDWKSPWERNCSGQAIIESEKNEIMRSVAFLQQLMV
ncbi:MAG: sugar phosphate isomerase/epimerase [Nitrospira sp.]|nr:sugar phosphate isomerase/epimerase [Nitrospira sp.]